MKLTDTTVRSAALPAGKSDFAFARKARASEAVDGPLPRGGEVD